MCKGTILIVEDDVDVADLLSLYLTKSDFKTIVCDGWDALTWCIRESIHLVLLDVMLPNANGFEICQEIRSFHDIPILFLSARTDSEDKINGLSLGADDYIVKPFNPGEVVARVAGHLRRYRDLTSKPALDDGILRVNGLEINEAGYTVRSGEDIVHLPAKEFQLLRVMAANPGRTYTPEELYESIWKSDAVGDARTVMVHLSNLRRKIEKDPEHPKYIVTIRGSGYQFVGSTLMGIEQTS